MPVLRIMAPDGSGRATETLTVATTDLIIGRSPECSAIVDHPTVSRHHARLSRVDSAWVLHDLRSTHGLTHLGRRVDTIVLRPGERFSIGAVQMEWDLEDRRLAQTIAPVVAPVVVPVVTPEPAWAPAGHYAAPRSSEPRAWAAGIVILVVGLSATAGWLVASGWVADMIELYPLAWGAR